MIDNIKMNKKEKDKMNKYLLQEIGYDFERLKYICSQVPIVYSGITGKRCSYAHYPASTIFEAMSDNDETQQRKLQDKIDELVEKLKGITMEVYDILD